MMTSKLSYLDQQIEANGFTRLSYEFLSALYNRNLFRYTCHQFFEYKIGVERFEEIVIPMAEQMYEEIKAKDVYTPRRKYRDERYESFHTVGMTMPILAASLYYLCVECIKIKYLLLKDGFIPDDYEGGYKYKFSQHRYILLGVIKFLADIDIPSITILQPAYERVSTLYIQKWIFKEKYYKPKR